MNCELDIEFREGNSYNTHDSFVKAVTNYAKQQIFQIRLVQEKIKLLHHAGCNISTIHAILKEEFNGVVTWVYNNLYNFVYQQGDIILTLVIL
ncbi:11255_t:CDS:2 [Cetraspora pellucida]|uniref:11255_t:CDS:1 n=1 Tax=Cetraspora pellucida TaxID=1433469 RepID=A0ACA9K0C1_9GLOM|nr:11255_t:CDS:2 [Cetraspora pellucida]